MVVKAEHKLLDAIGEVTKRFWNQGDGRADLDQIIEVLESDFADAIAEGFKHHRRQFLRSLINDYCRQSAEYTAAALLGGNDTMQVALPGMEPPAAIAIKDNNRRLYVGYYRATWADLQAGMEERATNISHAQRAFVDYQNKMDYLRPVMESNQTITVGEALAIISLRNKHHIPQLEEA